MQVGIRVRLHHHGIRANGFDALPRDHKVVVAAQQPQAAAATMQHHSGKAGRFFLKLNIIDAARFSPLERRITSFRARSRSVMVHSPLGVRFFAALLYAVRVDLFLGQIGEFMVYLETK